MKTIQVINTQSTNNEKSNYQPNNLAKLCRKQEYEPQAEGALSLLSDTGTETNAKAGFDIVGILRHMG